MKEELHPINELNFQEIVGETEVARVDLYADALIEDAIETNVSDIFLSDDEGGVSIKYRRLGRVHHVRTLAREYGKRLQNHIRAKAGIAIGDVHRSAEGRNRVQLSDNRVVDIRLSIMPTYYGQDLAIRIFDTQRGIITLESLGYVQEEYDALRRLLDIPSGMILVAGPTASGKSNSMYAFVDFLNDGTRKIHTLEDPIEYLLPGIVQSQVNHHVGLDFPELLFTVLRHSPDVIMIGEIRDMRTAEIAVRAANSGQLVLATVHAQSAASAIQSMMVYGVDSRFLANSIIGIVSQRLVRRLCSKCRIPIEDDTMPDPIAEIRNQLKSDPPLQWCLPNGCGHCRETGFDRLNLIAEVLEINPEIRALISEHASVEQLQAAAVENGMLTLEHSARINIASGLTTPEEVSRVLGGMGISQLSAAIRELEKNKAATATLTAASPA